MEEIPIRERARFIENKEGLEGGNIKANCGRKVSRAFDKKSRVGTLLTRLWDVREQRCIYIYIYNECIICGALENISGDILDTLIDGMFNEGRAIRPVTSERIVGEILKKREFYKMYLFN